ncbi:hypothetical protein B0O99DRAFT_126026 [Bisporella sp. PMI_857]|nr:hypothetical protein B0O99DRAFT_126026 [Bisporella sp. PMI_857]
MDDCSITPFSLDEAWLKKQIAVVNDRKTQAESRKLIRSTISSFTISAREEIQRLLQWRNDSAPKPYAWQVEAIAKYNEHTETSLAIGSQWILILKGGLLSSDNGILPTRDRNPWLLAPPSNPPIYNLGQVDPQRRYDINIPFHDDRPTYTRMSRRHVSLETLNQFRVAFELDKQDPEYVLIKRWVPEDEQDAIWTHTRDLRERRRHSAQVSLTKPSVSELSTDSSIKLEYFVKSKPKPKWKFKKGKKSQVAVPEEEKEGESRVIREGDPGMNGLYGSPRIYDFDAEAGQRGAALHSNDLLPQDEAERLIDEFLETFVEGSSDAKTSNDQAV